MFISFLLLQRFIDDRILAVYGGAHRDHVDGAVYQGDDHQYGGFGEMRQLRQHGRGDQGQHHEVSEVRRVHAIRRRIAVAVRAVGQYLIVGPTRYLRTRRNGYFVTPFYKNKKITANKRVSRILGTAGKNRPKRNSTRGKKPTNDFYRPHVKYNFVTDFRFRRVLRILI